MMARRKAEELEPFRLLWLELSSLMRESGNLYHNTTSLDNFVPIMVGLILHLYRLILVFPKRAVRAEWQKFALEVFLILYRHLYFLLVLYDHGETITNQCIEEIQIKVNLYKPAKNRKKFVFSVSLQGSLYISLSNLNSEIRNSNPV
nr:PREDICTED: uncharacterized protein LOC109044210 [Bemisia tabaci]